MLTNFGGDAATDEVSIEIFEICIATLVYL